MYVKVKKRTSTFGPFKALELEDGSKVNVSEKSKFYNTFDADGDYNITLGTSQKGNAMVVAASKIGQNGVVAQTVAPAAKVAQNTLISQNLDKKIDFERIKQKDIMIQCYMGRALDYLIATHLEKGFTVEDVTKVAYDFLAGHRSLAQVAEYKSEHGHGEDILLTEQAGPSVSSDDKKLAEDHERVPDEKPEQEDIPF